MINLESVHRLGAVVLSAGLVVGACSGSDSPDSATVGAAEPSAVAEETSTAVPEPSAVAEETSTAVPEPTATSPPQPTAELPCASVATGVTNTSLSAFGNEYDVQVFVPSAFDGQTPIPVVLNWHGLGSNGSEQVVFSGYEAVAETEGFIVVHPTGLPDEQGRASWQLIEDPDGQRDDLGFVDVLIDELVTNWCADPARVYSTGMSNGGFFTARLVCERADRVAAAVSVAGTYHLPDCQPARPVPYLGFHGTADLVVPFDGSGESVLLDSDSGPTAELFFSQVMPDEFAEFAEGAGCAADPVVTDVADDLIRYDYIGCTDDVPMSFVEVTDGGHTWPNSPMAAALAGTFGYFTTNVDATVDGWAFMSEHSLG